MSRAPPWSAEIAVALASARDAEIVAAALRPESAREVPRAGAALARPAPAVVALRLWADDAGAMRAALNTYLGWIDLALATARAAVGAPA